MTGRSMTEYQVDDPNAEAALWLMRERSGRMSDDERERFDAWLSSAENKAAYDALLAADAGLEEFGHELLAENFEAELHELNDEREARRLSWPQFTALAATLLVALVSVSFVLPGDSVSTVEFRTALGAQQRVPLEDGSVVTLNSGSEMEVSLARSHRDVDLERGEAFFDVARDQNRVFRVETDHGAITVVGTSFNVRTERDVTSVSVVSGIVDVRPEGGETVTLLAGESIRFGPSVGVVRKGAFDATGVLAWRRGRVVVADRPLSEVLDELNRYYPTPIVLGANAPADAPVTGEFPIDDPDVAVRGLTAALGLQAQTRQGGIVLSLADGAN